MADKISMMWKRVDHLLRKVVRHLFRGRQIFQPLWDWLNWLSLYGMNIGGGSLINESGELWVIDYFSKHISNNITAVVFDVGAHVGSYASEVISRLGKRVKICCFEPSKITFKLLADNIGNNENVELFNFGFGDKEEFVTLYSNAEGSGIASVYNRRLDHFGITMKNKEEIRVRKLDNFCSDEVIKHINFLKLDVEGHELKVLIGAQSLINSTSIDFIQFEMGPGNIDSNTYLRDFFDLLNQRYKIYRILKDGLALLETYQGRYEAFITTNYLAISRKI